MYLWGFWVATLCIRIPLGEKAHWRGCRCGFALWPGIQDSRPSGRALCRWCTTEPAGSRSLWSTADIDPTDNYSIDTLGKGEVNVKFVTLYNHLWRTCMSTHLKWRPHWMQSHNVHQTQRVYHGRSRRGTALSICECLLSAVTPLCIHSEEQYSCLRMG